MNVTIRQKISLQEVVHMEQSVKDLRHLVQISHSESCRLVLSCHPAMATMLRSYITSCVMQANALLEAQSIINKMYRTIIEEGCDEESAC